MIIFIFIGDECYPLNTLGAISYVWAKYQLIFQFSLLRTKYCLFFPSFRDFPIFLEVGIWTYVGIPNYYTTWVSSIALDVCLFILKSILERHIFSSAIHRFTSGNAYKMINVNSGTKY